MTTESGPGARGPRRATVLFLDLLGYDALVAAAGPEPAYLGVTGCVALLDGIARRHGGVVDKYLGDALMAVFGLASGSGGEEDAVAAALEMREGVASYARESASPAPLAVQIGINTGDMVVGDVRGAIVREFAVMGDAVNIAARLKDRAAPGAILIGGETRAPLPATLACRALEPLTLKGKQQRALAFELASDARLTRERAFDSELLVHLPLFGRARELEVLRAAASRVRAGQGGVVCVTGEAGSGKTRLLAEWLAREAEDNPALGVASARAAHADGGSLAALLRDVAARATTGPQALVVDDVPRADATVRAALAELAARTDGIPLLLLLSARDPIDLPARDGALHIALGPLAPAAAREIPLALLGQGASDAAIALVLARAAGNPGRLVLGSLLAPALETEARRAREAPERSGEAERRRATVLFADLSGFTALTETTPLDEAHAIVSRCLRMLDEVARRHGGSVDKYMGDCVMAVFGVPLAIEDAPRAAVNAAIEMRQRVIEANAARRGGSPLDLHVGIETGPAIAGEIRGPVLREWALMGESVNAASRLKDVSPPGEIWIGEESARATRGMFELEALAPTAQAGRRALTPFRVLSRETRMHRARLGSGETLFTRLVGRDAELSALRERVGRLARGEGGVVALVAEPGLGKSRLLAELAASDEAQACTWLEGRSISIGRNLAFHPFADLLRRFAGLSEGDVDAYDKLCEVLEPLLGADTAEAAPFLATLLGLELPPAQRERLAEMGGESLDHLVTRAVRAFISALAKRRPLVLVLEDLHWADLSSIELLESLFDLAREHPVVFLLAARPGFADTAERAVARAEQALEANALRLELAPLDSVATRELLGLLFAQGELPRQLRDRIEASAAGNPFFLEEVLRALLEQGALVSDGERLRATPQAASAVIPGSVQEVILSRVDRLAPQRKTLLQLASVIGLRFPRALLEAIARRALGAADGAPEALAAEIDRLVDAAFLVAGEEADQRLGFRHPMIQEVTYDSILEGRRALLHREVAEHLESSAAEAPGLHATLAYHFGLANDLARAEPHLLAAGEEAARSAASNEALHFFREASALYARLHPEGGDPALRAALAKNLALAHFNRGQLLDASERFNEALELRGEKVAKTRPAMVGRFALGLSGLLTELYLPLLTPHRPAADELDREIIATMFARAKAQTTGDPVRFLFDTMENVRRLRRVDARSVVGSGGMYASMIGIFSFGGISFGVADRLLRLARELVRPDDHRDRLQFAMMAYVHHFLSGDWSPEHEIDPATLEQGLRSGQLWDVVTHLHFEAYERLTRGEFADAQRRIDWIAAIERDYAYDFACSNRQATTLFLHTERRELDAAYEEALRYSRDHDEPQINTLALGARAKVELLRGEPEAARASLAAADEIVARVANLPPFNLGSSVRAQLQLAVFDLDAAARAGRSPDAELASRARRAARRAQRGAAKVAWLRPETSALAGRAALRLGRTRQGVALLERALAEADRLGAAPERARVAVEAAPLLGLDASLAGRPLRAHLDDSRRCFEALELRPDLERLDLVLAGRA